MALSLGLAASVSGVTKITDKMLLRAAEACNNSMLSEEVAEGRTFPNLKRIREVYLRYFLFQISNCKFLPQLCICYV